VVVPGGVRGPCPEADCALAACPLGVPFFGVVMPDRLARVLHSLCCSVSFCVLLCRVVLSRVAVCPLLLEEGPAAGQPGAGVVLEDHPSPSE
jgi:hypothetical protein